MAKSTQVTKTKKDLPTLLSREIQVKSPKISIGEPLTARYLLQHPHFWGLSTARKHSCTHLASFLILIESRRMVRLKIFYSPHRCPVANIHQQRQAQQHDHLAHIAHFQSLLSLVKPRGTRLLSLHLIGRYRLAAQRTPSLPDVPHHYGEQEGHHGHHAQRKLARRGVVDSQR